MATDTAPDTAKAAPRAAPRAGAGSGLAAAAAFLAVAAALAVAAWSGSGFELPTASPPAPALITRLAAGQMAHFISGAEAAAVAFIPAAASPAAATARAALAAAALATAASNSRPHIAWAWTPDRRELGAAGHCAPSDADSPVLVVFRRGEPSFFSEGDAHHEEDEARYAPLPESRYEGAFEPALLAAFARSRAAPPVARAADAEAEEFRAAWAGAAAAGLPRVLAVVSRGEALAGAAGRALHEAAAAEPGVKFFAGAQEDAAGILRELGVPADTPLPALLAVDPAGRRHLKSAESVEAVLPEFVFEFHEGALALAPAAGCGATARAEL